ncbi:MAG: Acetyltransferase [Frankiales bacterium]|nr:Acetyltransferase [Frankiales bacterium]
MTTQVQVRSWTPTELADHGDEVLDVYAEAMQVPRPQAGMRKSILATHSGRVGLRAIAAVDSGEHLVGIAYGHLGEPGQWWHDQVMAAVVATRGPHAADPWQGAFEVCELHVRPGLQGTGLGRTLLDRLLDGPPAGAALLTTPDSETRARGFYRAGGWEDLVRHLRFPGDPREFAVLGLRLA